MKKKFTLKNIGLTLLIVFIILQFFRIDKATKALDPAKDFALVTHMPADLAATLKNSCYDCHSNQPEYPWYTNVAPVSWWIKNHISEGSKHLNFSEWSTYGGRKADHKLKECGEMLEENEMPLPSYLIMHGDAKLSPDQKLALLSWFATQRTNESEKPKDEEED